MKKETLEKTKDNQPIMDKFFLPRGILVDKETGQQCEVVLESDISIWPTESKEEPSQPEVYTKTVTFSLPKIKATKQRKLIRNLTLTDKTKIPRKLKKALRHVGFFRLPMERIETENGFAFKQTVGFGPKDGYPCTKWVNRACLKLKANAIYIIERQFSAENYKQRGPHSYILPTN